MTPVVGVVGLGLIGGSVGLGLVRAGYQVLGFDSDLSVAERALTQGACTTIRPTLEGLYEAEIVIVAVPPTLAVPVLREIPMSCAIVTDCTSVKGPVMTWAEADETARRRFVGGHPMAGFERGGLEHACADLFQGAPWILCPTPIGEESVIAAVEAMVRDLGARPLRMDADTHDRHVAWLSHIPHVLAAILVRQATHLEHRGAGGGSWRDLTRVAGAEPELWRDILALNAPAVRTALASLREEIERLEASLGDGDIDALREFFVLARQAKEGA